MNDSTNYYIPPKYVTPSGFIAKYPDPIQSFLDLSSTEGSLSILIGEPGQGKTYGTQYIISSLKNSIPIYINSTQWEKLTEDDLSSIWKTIVHSLGYYGVATDWIKDCEYLFLKVMLKAGIFVLIFDGFDEYILRNNGKVDPVQAINVLWALASESEAKILVTTRTSFWEDIEKSKEINTQVSVYEILPFDQNRANNYFKKRFNDNVTKVKSANNLYMGLSKKAGENFVGRGFIIYLIADICEDAISASENASIENIDIIEGLIIKLCKREEFRQQLPINSEQQVKVFREMSRWLALDQKITQDFMESILKESINGITDKNIYRLLSQDRKSRGKLNDHPLLRRDSNGWNFKHEQIYMNILADEVIHLLKINEPLAIDVQNRFPFVLDLARCIYEHIEGAMKTEDKITLKLKEIISTLLSVNKHIDFNKIERYLVTVIALLAVNKTLAREGTERKERSEVLYSLFPNKKIDGVAFLGTIGSFDFRGRTISNSYFNQAVWARCVFDEKTTLINCRVNGGRVESSENYGLINFADCVLDEAASSVINTQQIVSKKRKYDNNDLERDVKQLLNKFLAKGGSVIKTVSEADLRRGQIENSPHGSIIIEKFKMKLLNKHTLASVSEHAYNIKDTAKSSLGYYAINNVFTGSIQEMYKELSKLLFGK